MRPARPHRLVRSEPWLSQGDLFMSVPIVDVTMPLARTLSASFQRGPAMLVSQDCVLDKASRGRPTIERLAFIPVRRTDSLPSDRVAGLRAMDAKPRPECLQPFAAQYLGEIEQLGDTYVLMSDVFSLPVEYFDVALTNFGLDAEGTPQVHLSVPGTFDRSMRLGPDDLDLFQHKYSIFWTRLELDE